jgi:hypothetical protein
MSEERQIPPITGFHTGMETVDAFEIGKEREQKLARKLINNLFVLLKTAYMHQQNNAALIRPLENIQETVNAIFQQTREDILHLRMVSNTFFLNDTMIRMDEGTFQNAEFLRVICEELNVGDWEFRNGCGEKEFRALMVTIVDTVRSGTGSGAPLNRDLGLIVLKPRVPGAIESQSLMGRRQFVLHTYATALAFSINLVALWPQGRRPRLSAVKRIVQSLLDVVQKDTVSLLGLMQLRAYRKHLANHFVNVAILSLIIGRHAGLDKHQLVRLGMTAFLHDLGAVGLPEEVIQSSVPLGEAEQKELSTKLPILSVSFLAELTGGGGEGLTRLISVYENRAHVPDAPTFQMHTEPDPVVQIITVADAYDYLTSPRMGNTRLRPDQALTELLRNQEGKYADWAVKLLAEAIGHYPIGTLVELDTGERGIVFDLPPDGAPGTCPRIRLIRDRDTAPIEGCVVVDLGEADTVGRPLRAIVRTLDTDEEGLDVQHFFLD